MPRTYFRLVVALAPTAAPINSPSKPSMEQQEQPPPSKKKCEGIPSTEQDNDPCIIIVYNDDATIFQACGLDGSVIRTTDAANNPLAPQTVADNFKAWVAAVVLREGGLPVTEKHPVVYRGLYHKMTNPQKEEALKELGDNPTWVSSCHTANVYVGCLLTVTGAQWTMTVVPFQTLGPFGPWPF